MGNAVKKPKKIDAKKLKVIKQDLLERRHDLITTVRTRIGDCGSCSGEMGEAAFQAITDDIASQLAQAEAVELDNIVEALRRIDIGTFGMCAWCAEMIPSGRLEALPYSKYCIDCQRRIEEGEHPPQVISTNEWPDDTKEDEMPPSGFKLPEHPV